MELRVELGDDDPKVVWFGSRRLPVLAMVDRWWGADARWWKVETADGACILRRAMPDGPWELAAVPRSQAATGRGEGPPARPQRSKE